MTIGINWKAIWKPVWKAVWQQALPDENVDVIKPKRRAKLTVYKKPKPVPVPKVRKARKAVKKAVKFLPPIQIRMVEPEPLVTVKIVPTVYAEIRATLEGCTARAFARTKIEAKIVSTLEGASMEATARLTFYDDALSLAMGIPDLEPEAIEA